MCNSPYSKIVQNWWNMKKQNGKSNTDAYVIFHFNTFNTSKFLILLLSPLNRMPTAVPKLVRIYCVKRVTTSWNWLNPFQVHTYICVNYQLSTTSPSFTTKILFWMSRRPILQNLHTKSLTIYIYIYIIYTSLGFHHC